MHSMKLKVDNMAADGLPTNVDVGITHSLADTYSRNTSVGVRGYATNRYAKTKDTAYTKIIADKGLNLHYRSAVMETYGAFGDSLWGIITELTDPNTHPRASGDYDPWSRPDRGAAPSSLYGHVLYSTACVMKWKRCCNAYCTCARRSSSLLPGYLLT